MISKGGQGRAVFDEYDLTAMLVVAGQTVQKWHEESPPGHHSHGSETCTSCCSSQCSSLGRRSLGIASSSGGTSAGDVVKYRQMEESCHQMRSSLLIHPAFVTQLVVNIKSGWQFCPAATHMYAQHVPTEWQPHLSIDQVTGALRVLARAQAMRSALVGLLACPAPLLTANYMQHIVTAQVGLHLDGVCKIG
jgi:hypothetical protein